MLTSAIISLFELYLDDTSELSSDEELALANRIYKKICRQRPWEFLKKPATGSITSGYITLPADFAFLAMNNQSDEQNADNNDPAKVIFVGSTYRPVQVVNFSDRRAYRDSDGHAYLDLTNNKLVFCKAPTETTYEFDYIYIPADLTLNTSPVFPIAHEIIAWGMATDSYIIQQFDKAKSYQLENQLKYNSDLSDLAYYNSQLIV